MPAKSTRKASKKIAAVDAGPEGNLKRLKKTTVLMNFVKKNKGCWEHGEWLGLCDSINKKYSPIDYDQVGLVLEEKKAAYLEKQSS